MTGLSEITMTFNVAGQANEVTPRLVRLYAPQNTLAQVSAAGFLDYYLMSQGYNLLPTDFVAVAASDGFDWYRPIFTPGHPASVQLVELPGTAVAPIAFTPVVTFATPGDLSVAYVNQGASYFRNGNLVTLNIDLLFTPTYTTASGELRITGSPFTALDSAFGSVTSNFPLGAGYTYLTSAISTATSYLNVYENGSGQPITAISTAQLTSGSQYQLKGSIIYLI